MTRPLAFRVRVSPPAEPAPLRYPGLVIALMVVGSWAACVGAAWVIAGAVRLAARVLA